MKTVGERVYVIGAGASVPSGLPTLKRLTGELYKSLTGDDQKLFSAAVYESFSKRPDDNPDFEELLNRLDPQALFYLVDTGLGGPNSDRQRAMRLALTALRHFIREKCLAVAGKPSPYDRLVGPLDDGSTLVSFNWDVLLENAFNRAGRAFSYLPKKRSPGCPVILKPHGSINWFALLDRELLDLAGDSNLDVLGDDLSDYMLYLKEPLAAIKFGSSGPFLRAALSKLPAIVPPTAAKILSVGGVPRDDFVQAGHVRAMTKIWSTFRSAVDRARELVVIGYSLPGTDAASIELFKHFAAAGKSGGRRIILVEPDPAVETRYKTLLDADVEVVCKDFSNFDPDAI